MATKETSLNGVLQDSNLLAVENGILNSGKNRKSFRDQGKENKPSTKTESQKVPKKSTKESLKVITGRKSERQSPLKRKAGAKSPTVVKKDKKTQTVPKIIIYKDEDTKKQKRTCCKVSKSWEGRTSVPPIVNSPKVSAPKSNRHSFNDLYSLHSDQKNEKSNDEKTKRSPKLKLTDPEFLGMVSKLEILFPGVDPEYLKSQFIKFKYSLSETIEFILMKEKADELPTRADYVRKKEAENHQNKFLESFTVEKFLEMIPDPWEFFLKVERHNCRTYAEHSLHYLKNKFKKHYIQAIQDALTKNEYSLYLAHRELNKKNRSLKMRVTNRSKHECDIGKPLNFNLQFIQEVAFVENERQIKAHLKKVEAAKQKKIEKAQKEGALLECHSCTESGLLKDDTVTCPVNHTFCKDCVIKYVSIEMKEDYFQFKCLMKCEEKFSLESLQAVLSPFAMVQIIKRNKLEECKSAGIDDLVSCPFCYYVTILSPQSTVIKCQNPKCLMETCRNCKQLNHKPLKCHELIEKSEKVISTENEAESPIKCSCCNNEIVEGKNSKKTESSYEGAKCSICQEPLPECLDFKKPQSPPPGEHPKRVSFCSDGNECMAEDNNNQHEENLSDEDTEDDRSSTDHYELFLSSSGTY